MASDDDISQIESLVLRRHAEIFVRCSDCTPLLGVLRANNIINEVEYQRIKAKQTSLERNGYVIITLRDKVIAKAISVCACISHSYSLSSVDSRTLHAHYVYWAVPIL